MKKISLLLLTPILLSCGAQTANQTTTTALPTTTTTPENPVLIAAVGDISCSTAQRAEGVKDCQDEAVAQLVKSQNPDYFFALGDIQYNSGTPKEFELNFNRIWKDLLPITRFVIGNHDVDPGLYYGIDVSSRWRVVVLDTNDQCKTTPCDDQSPQYRWLEKDLRENSDKCFIAMTHYPRYSSGVHGNMAVTRTFYRLFQKSNNVSLLLSGHDHHYERFNTRPVQIVAGTGGQDLRKVSRTAENSQTIIDDAHGAVFLEIVGDIVTVRFMNTNATTLETFDVRC